MDLAAWVTGIGAILSGLAGVALIVREIRSRQRREIRRLDNELEDLHEELIDYQRYTFELRENLSELGLETPEPPRREPYRSSPRGSSGLHSPRS